MTLREVGPVRLVCELGRGGMGVVWRGRHQVLGRDVAVKFLLNAVAGAEDPAFEGLVAEARAAAAVRHANLVPIYHADVADGVPYLVMEYVDGPSLARLAAAGAITPGVAMSVLADAAAAVEALHERGLIHRDLKPANILLGPDAHVYVADFGLALPHKRGGPQSHAAPAGTPLYMAPEAFDGQFSPRSDVYALGVVAFELLTSRPPFTAPTPDSLRQLHATAPLPLERLREAGVPEELTELIGRATNKAPVFRYKSAREFGHALAALAAERVPRQRTDLRRLVIRVSASPAGTPPPADEATEKPKIGDGTTALMGTPTGSTPAAPWDDVLSRVTTRFRKSRREAAAGRNTTAGDVDRTTLGEGKTTSPPPPPPAPESPAPALPDPSLVPPVGRSTSASRTSYAGRIATIVLGLLVGAGLGLWLFVLAVTGSSADFLRGALFPLLLAVGAGVTFGALASPHWLWAAAALSAPTTILTLTFFATAGPERPGAGWDHLAVAAAFVAASVAGATCGRMLRLSQTPDTPG